MANLKAAAKKLREWTVSDWQGECPCFHWRYWYDKIIHVAWYGCRECSACGGSGCDPHPPSYDNGPWPCVECAATGEKKVQEARELERCRD